jgi:hypothetical protein
MQLVGSARKPGLVVLCLGDVGRGANGGGREFFKQVVILNDAKHYISGRASTQNGRKISPRLPRTLRRRSYMTRGKAWLDELTLIRDRANVEG